VTKEFCEVSDGMVASRPQVEGSDKRVGGDIGSERSDLLNIVKVVVVVVV